MKICGYEVKGLVECDDLDNQYFYTEDKLYVDIYRHLEEGYSEVSVRGRNTTVSKTFYREFIDQDIAVMIEAVRTIQEVT